MGGGLLQQVNRDSMHFAMKANAAKVNGEWRAVNKKPSDSGLKASKAGRLALVKENGDYKTVARDSVPESENLLETVFRNGKLVKRQHLKEIIARSEAEVPKYYWESIMSDDFDADFTSNAY
jgi:nicotinamide phosphoribosyltransferase